MGNTLIKINEILEKTWGKDECNVIKLHISDNSAKILYFCKWKNEYIVHSVNLYEGCEGLHNGFYSMELIQALKNFEEKII